MENRVRYTFNKSLRLKSRKIIDRLFTEGKTCSFYPLRLIYSFESPPPQYGLHVGFSVSTKSFRKAAERNRIKRLMKESFRLQKNILIDQLKTRNRRIAVFILFTGNEMPAYEIVSSKMQAIVRHLFKFVNEDRAAGS